MSSFLRRRMVAELIATGFLLAAIVGSGIMGERLAAGNVAVALLANSLATGGALLALIATFQPIIRWVEVDRERRMRPEALARMVDADRAAGLRPFLVTGTAGTVGTGAVDPLEAIG